MRVCQFRHIRDCKSYITAKSGKSQAFFFEIFHIFFEKKCLTNGKMECILKA